MVGLLKSIAVQFVKPEIIMNTVLWEIDFSKPENQMLRENIGIGQETQDILTTENKSYFLMKVFLKIYMNLQ